MFALGVLIAKFDGEQIGIQKLILNFTPSLKPISHYELTMTPKTCYSLLKTLRKQLVTGNDEFSLTVTSNRRSS